MSPGPLSQEQTRMKPLFKGTLMLLVEEYCVVLCTYSNPTNQGTAEEGSPDITQQEQRWKSLKKEHWEK